MTTTAEQTFKAATTNMLNVYYAFGPEGVNVAGDFALKALGSLLDENVDTEKAFAEVRSLFVEDIENLEEERQFVGRSLLWRAQGAKVRRAFEGLRDAKTVAEAAASTL